MIDFWCLGVTMYKLLCGRLPFSEEQIASLVSYLRVSVERRATDMPDLVNDYSAFLQDALVNRPDLMTADTGRFLVDLFQVDYHERIGHGPDGLNNIKHHPCFKNIDWKRLARRNVLPPFIPQEVKPALESMVEHESFFDCLAYIKHTSWDIQAPPPEKDRYFASWSFVSAIALETEIELERQSCSNGKLLMVETDGAQHGISQISSQTATHNDYHSNSIDDIVTRIKSLISSTGAPITPMSPITSGKKYNSESEMMVSIERKCVPNK